MKTTNKKIYGIDRMVTWILAGIVGIEIAFLIYYNCITDYVFDCDAAKLMYHAVEMWENKSLIIPNWTYMTTGEWDCSSILAMPIYGMTGNITLSFAIANIINIVLFVLIIGILMKAVDVPKKYILLALSIIFVPYCWGMLEYTNMLFYSGAQYVYKVLTPLSLLAVFHHKKSGEKTSVLRIILYIFTEIMIFMTTSASSLFVVVCGIMPILACRIFNMFVHEERRRSVQEWFEIVSTVLVVLGGYATHKIYGVSSNADNMMLHSINEIGQAFGQNNLNLMNIMQVLPTEGIEVFSGDGITSLLKCLLFSCIIVMALPCIKTFMCLDQLVAKETIVAEEDDQAKLLKSELVSIFIYTYVVTLLTSSTPRYLLIGFIPLILVAIMQLSSYEVSRIIDICMIMVIFLLNIFLQHDAYIGVTKIFPDNYDKEICNSILEIANENGAEVVVLYGASDWAEVMRAYNTDSVIVTYQPKKDCIADYDYVNTLTTEVLHSEKSILAVPLNRSKDLLEQTITKYNYVYMKDADGMAFYIHGQ